MSELQGNEGIGMYGGRLSSEVIAVGRNAQAIKTVTGDTERKLQQKDLREILTKLREFEVALNEHSKELGSKKAAEVAEATQEVAQKIVAEEPNRTSITGVLTAIVDGVKGVTGVATAAQALKVAVETFLK